MYYHAFFPISKSFIQLLKGQSRMLYLLFWHAIIFGRFYQTLFIQIIFSHTFMLFWPSKINILILQFLICSANLLTCTAQESIPISCPKLINYPSGESTVKIKNSIQHLLLCSPACKMLSVFEVKVKQLIFRSIFLIIQLMYDIVKFLLRFIM